MESVKLNFVLKIKSHLIICLGPSGWTPQRDASSVFLCFSAQNQRWWNFLSTADVYPYWQHFLCSEFIILKQSSVNYRYWCMFLWKTSSTSGPIKCEISGCLQNWSCWLVLRSQTLQQIQTLWFEFITSDIYREKILHVTEVCCLFFLN